MGATEKMPNYEGFSVRYGEAAKVKNSVLEHSNWQILPRAFTSSLFDMLLQ